MSLAINDIQLCYFAALIDGLRLINEKAQEKGIDLKDFDSDGLVQYVRHKGDQVVASLWGCRQNSDSIPKAKALWPKEREERNPGRSLQIIKLIRKGLSNREIGRAMKANPHTVGNVRKTISGDIPQCRCGQPATHRGWCAFKLARYPKRKHFLEVEIQKLPQNVSGPPGCGLTKSTEHREAIAKALSGKPKSTKHARFCRRAAIGLVHSEATRAVMREKARLRWEKVRAEKTCGAGAAAQPDLEKIAA